MAGAMGVVRLPVAPDRAGALRDRLLELGTDAPVHAIDGSVWVRISAFAYNRIEDYAALADLLARAMREGGA